MFDKSFCESVDGTVIITWRECGDWHHYRIIGLDYLLGWIRLQGVAAPDGTPFTGGPIWVPMTDIAMIEEVNSEPM